MLSPIIRSISHCVGRVSLLCVCVCVCVCVVVCVCVHTRMRVCQGTMSSELFWACKTNGALTLCMCVCVCEALCARVRAHALARWAALGLAALVLERATSHYLAPVP